MNNRWTQKEQCKFRAFYKAKSQYCEFFYPVFREELASFVDQGSLIELQYFMNSTTRMSVHEKLKKSAYVKPGCGTVDY